MLGMRFEKQPIDIEHLTSPISYLNKNETFYFVRHYRIVPVYFLL